MPALSTVSPTSQILQSWNVSFLSLLALVSRRSNCQVVSRFVAAYLYTDSNCRRFIGDPDVLGLAVRLPPFCFNQPTLF